MKQGDKESRIVSLLQNEGLVGSGDISEKFCISRSTLARWLSNISQKWVSIGNTRNIRYGLLRQITGLDSELPLYRINSQGKILLVGKLAALYQKFCVVKPQDQVFTGLPPEIADMSPQGFMGRAFARKYSGELNLPPRLEDWSGDHFLKAIALRGEDLPGNLIVGKESAERWQKIVYQPTRRSSFNKLAELALQEQPAGSSAGGERPKFSVWMQGKHALVKFAGPSNLPEQKRWRDLLYCEAIASSILQKAGIDSASTKISESDGFTFLEVTRFDRLGEKGRRPVLNLAGVDDFLFGERDSWANAAERLYQNKLLSKEDAKKIKLLDAFSRLIGDTDRHFYNVCLFPTFESEESLTPKFYELAPSFDKTPMIFAPVNGQIIDRDFKMELPGAELFEVWNEALNLAQIFWAEVAGEKRVSFSFRKIASKCLEAL